MTKNTKIRASSTKRMKQKGIKKGINPRDMTYSAFMKKGRTEPNYLLAVAISELKSIYENFTIENFDVAKEMLKQQIDYFQGCFELGFTVEKFYDEQYKNSIKGIQHQSKYLPKSNRNLN